jgi:hypothetical protein
MAAGLARVRHVNHALEALRAQPIIGPHHLDVPAARRDVAEGPVEVVKLPLVAGRADEADPRVARRVLGGDGAEAVRAAVGE